MAALKKALKLLVTASRGPRKGQKIIRRFKTQKGYNNFLKSGKGKVPGGVAGAKAEESIYKISHKELEKYFGKKIPKKSVPAHMRAWSEKTGAKGFISDSRKELKKLNRELGGWKKKYKDVSPSSAEGKLLKKEFMKKAKRVIDIEAKLPKKKIYMKSPGPKYD